jgi:hypothetical protein
VSKTGKRHAIMTVITKLVPEGLEGSKITQSIIWL